MQSFRGRRASSCTIRRLGSPRFNRGKMAAHLCQPTRHRVPVDAHSVGDLCFVAVLLVEELDQTAQVSGKAFPKTMQDLLGGKSTSARIRGGFRRRSQGLCFLDPAFAATPVGNELGSLVVERFGEIARPISDGGRSVALEVEQYTQQLSLQLFGVPCAKSRRDFPHERQLGVGGRFRWVARRRPNVPPRSQREARCLVTWGAYLEGEEKAPAPGTGCAVQGR
jgi:hypothetical protein